MPSERRGPARVPKLTRREKDIVSELLDGHGNREIAQRLGVSAQTVKNGLSKLYRKLGVGGRVGLVRFADKNRLLD